MGKQFSRINTPGLLDELVKRSESEPVIVFKHSTTCPISAMAYAEMQRVEKEVNLVEVQGDREISDQIAERTGLRHESPQVILLRRGKAVWDASHWDIKAKFVAEAVRANL